MAYEFKTRPYNHQREALRQARGRRAYAYFMEMGTGKSKVAIDEAGLLYCEGEINAVLILAPKGVYMNWINSEIPTHMPDDIRDAARIVHWLPGGGSKAHQRLLADLLEPRPGLRVLVMNTEALSSGKKAYNFADRFLRGSRNVAMYVDESTFIKNPQSNRTQSVCKLGLMAKYRRIMTGSPVTRSPLDLYSQFEFLQEGILGSRSYYAFRARFAVMQQKDFGGRKVQIVVGYKNTEELTERVSQHSYRVTKNECLDLPEKIYTRRDVEMTDEQSSLYAQMREFAFAELGDGDEQFVSASAVITQILRLHQISCGHVTDENGVVHSVKNNRVSTLMDVVSETDGKVIIWARYRHDIREITAELRRVYGDEAVAEYHGGNGKTRQDDADRFINDPACLFMVSNQQTGGYGNTWVVANTVVYYSNDYDLEKRLQSEDRAHRSGQTRSVTYVDLVCPGTVDERILKALRNKINISDAIMGDGYRDWLV